MSVAKKDYKRVTTKSLIEMKADGEKISMLTAYDYSMAKIVDAARIQAKGCKFYKLHTKRHQI